MSKPIYRLVFAPRVSNIKTLATAHAPADGITIAGKRFRGGQFIPDEHVAKATDEQKAKLEIRKGLFDDAEKTPENTSTTVDKQNGNTDNVSGGKTKPQPEKTMGDQKEFVHSEDGYSLRIVFDDDDEGDGLVTVKTPRGEKGFRLTEPRDLPKPIADALKKSGLNPSDYIAIAGHPVRKSAMPTIEVALHRQGEIERQKESTIQNIPGLEELSNAEQEHESYHYKFGKMMDDEFNDGARPPKGPKSNLKALRGKYPIAALYLDAERQSLAAHDEKAAAGKKAMKMLEAGESPEEAKKVMENWLSASATWN